MGAATHGHQLICVNSNASPFATCHHAKAQKEDPKPNCSDIQSDTGGRPKRHQPDSRCRGSSHVHRAGYRRDVRAASHIHGSIGAGV